MDFPMQQPSARKMSGSSARSGAFDMRKQLTPERLTIVMWDQAYLLRHGPGGSFQDFDRVLDETIERGYNTLRLDPMQQWIDLAEPDKILSWPDPKQPYMPWCWNTAVSGPVGRWQIEFMEKVLKRRHDLSYTLSSWWFCGENGPTPRRTPRTHMEAAEMWVELLTQWKSRFGFDGLVYVDLENETPFFLPGFMDRFSKAGEGQIAAPGCYPPGQAQLLTSELNDAMRYLRAEFPELLFTTSIHGDLRWLDLAVEFDCLDVHFYSDADPRWQVRTKFHSAMSKFFTETAWQKDFSDRCMKTHRAMAPMLRAAQRDKLRQFAQWAEARGMPLTTSESWAAWFYIDSPDLDWGWLLDWSAWSVDDAVEFGMWGWTPHNYCQPHFANWQDIAWHQRLTERFLKG